MVKPDNHEALMSVLESYVQRRRDNPSTRLPSQIALAAEVGLSRATFGRDEVFKDAYKEAFRRGSRRLESTTDEEPSPHAELNRLRQERARLLDEIQVLAEVIQEMWLINRNLSEKVETAAGAREVDAHGGLPRIGPSGRE